MRDILAAGKQLEFVPKLDGVEAIRQAHSHRPDVILMDLVMPNLNGVEAVAIEKTLRDVQIILLTIHGEEIRQVVPAVDMVISKWNGEALVEALQNFAPGNPAGTPSLNH